jgi:hypothetical protein
MGHGRSSSGGMRPIGAWPRLHGSAANPRPEKHLTRVHFGKNVLFNPGRVDETVSWNASFGERSSTLETFEGSSGRISWLACHGFVYRNGKY